MCCTAPAARAGLEPPWADKKPDWQAGAGLSRQRVPTQCAGSVEHVPGAAQLSAAQPAQQVAQQAAQRAQRAPHHQHPSHPSSPPRHPRPPHCPRRGSGSAPCPLRWRWRPCPAPRRPRRWAVGGPPQRRCPARPLQAAAAVGAGVRWGLYQRACWPTRHVLLHALHTEACSHLPPAAVRRPFPAPASCPTPPRRSGQPRPTQPPTALPPTHPPAKSSQGQHSSTSQVMASESRST